MTPPSFVLGCQAGIVEGEAKAKASSEIETKDAPVMDAEPAEQKKEEKESA